MCCSQQLLSRSRCSATREIPTLLDVHMCKCIRYGLRPDGQTAPHSSIRTAPWPDAFVSPVSTVKGCKCSGCNNKGRMCYYFAKYNLLILC